MFVGNSRGSGISPAKANWIVSGCLFVGRRVTKKDFKALKISAVAGLYKDPFSLEHALLWWDYFTNCLLSRRILQRAVSMVKLPLKDFASLLKQT